MFEGSFNVELVQWNTTWNIMQKASFLYLLQYLVLLNLGIEIGISRWWGDATCTHEVQGFFFGGCGGQVGIFLFSFVPNVFPSSYQRVPPQVPNSNTILSHMLCLKFSSFYLDSLIKGKAFYLWIETSILRKPSRIFLIFFWVNGPIKMAYWKPLPHTHTHTHTCNKKKVELGTHPM